MEFSLNGNYWYVIKVNSNSELLKRSDGSLSVGVCDNNVKCVYISDVLTNGFLRKVLLHEVSHCFCFEYGLVMSIEQEEMLCDFVSTYCDDIVEIVNGLERFAVNKFCTGVGC